MSHERRPSPSLGRRPRSFDRSLRTVGLGLALCLASCAKEERPPNILFLSVDTLRPDHLSLYGYERETSPHLDAFFEDATVFTRAYAAEAATAPSVVSFLTGRYPANHGVRLLYQKLEPDIAVLPELLRERGYQSAGVVSNIVLTEEALGISSRFDHYDDFVDERESGRDGIFERRAGRTTDAALTWLATKRSAGQPHFLWVHYIDPHGPYLPPEDKPKSFSHEGSQPIDMERVHTYQHVDGVDDGLTYIDRYDEEIAYTDREIGRLLDAYRELGLDENTVVVFTADHGETMVEYDRYFTHGYHIWEPIVKVPLLLRVPGRGAARHEAPVSLVDLVPTLLELAGAEVPPGLDGMPLGSRPARSPISVEATHGKSARGAVQHRGLIRGDDKWFLTVDNTRKVRRRAWIDLETLDEGSMSFPRGKDQDFAKLLEWVAQDPDPAGRPRQYDKGTNLDGPKVAPGRTEAELEALRALGYVDVD